MTQKEKILNLMSDNRWHSSIELNKICWRYGARLYDLRKKGYKFEKKKHPTKKVIELWRLTYTPSKIKLILDNTRTAVQSIINLKF